MSKPMVYDHVHFSCSWLQVHVDAHVMFLFMLYYMEIDMDMDMDMHMTTDMDMETGGYRNGHEPLMISLCSIILFCQVRKAFKHRWCRPSVVLFTFV